MFITDRRDVRLASLGFIAAIAACWLAFRRDEPTR